ncbi:sugar kinase [Cnuibacter sp. UC19_7]|uniref:sugar kinase n=1 Tax=Cnuibacter sp. UC19_7 TaxID=3350166 RepID=UPI0036735EE9
MSVVLTLGEPLATLTVDDVDPTVIAVHVAGAELNTAVGLARQGIAVRWFSRSADDAFGSLVLDTLRREGIDASRVVHADGERTGLIVKRRLDDHTVRSEHYRAGSAASRLSPAEVPGDLLDGVDLLHVTGITPATGEGPRWAWTALVRSAAERGVPVSLDVNHRPQLVDDDGIREIVDSVIDSVDTLLCNEEEAQLLTGEADPERALAALVERGPRTVVLKLGRRGALVGLADGRTLRGGVWPVPLPTFPVGAGDAFNAGWIAATLAGVEPEIALPLAAWTASRVVADPGDHDGFPTAEEIAEMREALGRGERAPEPFGIDATAGFVATAVGVAR